MSTKNYLNSYSGDYETVIAWISQQLTAHALVVKPSFDLQAAKSAHTGCTCPHHGTKNCDCQIVVLLVYGKEDGPVSIVIHSQDGTTFSSLADRVNGEENNNLVEKVVHSLGNQNFQVTK